MTYYTNTFDRFAAAQDDDIDGLIADYIECAARMVEGS